MILIENVTYRDIVRDASLSAGSGALTVLLGPNGAGKTTLLRLALGLLRPDAGRIAIDGDDPQSLRPDARARRVSYLPQARPLAWAARVRDVVALGRFAYGVAPGRLGGEDADAVEHALAACDLAHLADRSADTLSGGEAARMHLARALAARSPMIVADEPVASLDPRHQHRVLALLRDHVDRGGGALVVLHDLDLAARYADRLVWMHDGRTVAEGSVAATMTRERIAAVYGVDAHVDRSGATIAVRIDRAQ